MLAGFLLGSAQQNMRFHTRANITPRNTEHLFAVPKNSTKLMSMDLSKSNKELTRRVESLGGEGLEFAMPKNSTKLMSMDLSKSNKELTRRVESLGGEGLEIAPACLLDNR